MSENQAALHPILKHIETDYSQNGILNRRRRKSLSSVSTVSSAASVLSTSSSSSIASERSVRFNATLNKIKLFNKHETPSSISSPSSPNLNYNDESSIDMLYSNNNILNLDLNDENVWFNSDNSTILPLLKRKNSNTKNKPVLRKSKHNQLFNSDNSNIFLLDNLCDYDLDDIIQNTTTYNNNNDNLHLLQDFKLNTTTANQSIRRNWHLFSIDSNVKYITNLPNDQQVKLIEFKQSIENSDLLLGSILVKNLSFHKCINVKFTLNNWSDIHLIKANFKKSINSNFDIFDFSINVRHFIPNNFKTSTSSSSSFSNNNNKNENIFLQICIKYSVNDVCYFDNNFNNNYIMVLSPTANEQSHNDNIYSNNASPIVSPKTVTRSSTMKQNKIHNNNTTNTNSDIKSLGAKFNSKKNKTTTRRFNPDTDYFNNSPMKDIYYNQVKKEDKELNDKIQQKSKQIKNHKRSFSNPIIPTENSNYFINQYSNLFTNVSDDNNTKANVNDSSNNSSITSSPLLSYKNLLQLNSSQKENSNDKDTEFTLSKLSINDPDDGNVSDTTLQLSTGYNNSTDTLLVT